MSHHLSQAIRDCIAACNDCATECGNLNRPGFSRHLRALHYGNHGGGYEQHAVYG